MSYSICDDESTGCNVDEPPKSSDGGSDVGFIRIRRDLLSHSSSPNSPKPSQHNLNNDQQDLKSSL